MELIRTARTVTAYTHQNLQTFTSSSKLFSVWLIGWCTGYLITLYKLQRLRFEVSQQLRFVC